jgi:hypothetical protein
MTNIERAMAQPYGDNLVARCDYCGKPVFKCTCDDEDEADIEDQMFEIERGYTSEEEPTDAFGRNYSDADQGL